MSKRTLITDELADEFVKQYVEEKLSILEITRNLNVSMGVIHKYLKLKDVKLRTVAEGNSLKWQNPEFRNNQVQKRTEKPSPALGKTWKVEHIFERPNLKGKKSHFWRGGKMNLQNEIRKSYKYRVWRTSVFVRDNFNCVFCGKIGGKLNADHIKPFSQILVENSISSKEAALECVELWNLENGRTLCLECHKQTPTYLNNKYQLTEDWT